MLLLFLLWRNALSEVGNSRAQREMDSPLLEGVVEVGNVHMVVQPNLRAVGAGDRVAVELNGSVSVAISILCKRGSRDDAVVAVAALIVGVAVEWDTRRRGRRWGRRQGVGRGGAC